MKKIFTTKFPWIFALTLTVVYFGLSLIASQMFEGRIRQDALGIAQSLQGLILFPLSKFLNVRGYYSLFVFPWLLVIGFLLWRIHLLLKGRYRWVLFSMGILLLTLRMFPNVLLLTESSQPSKSLGTANSGSLQYGKRIPFSGANFTTYSFIGYLAGRTFVHERLRKTVLETYNQCEEKLPGITFVLMETGHREGGYFPPHRTHRNGLSVDFMTPMIKKGEPHQSHHLFKGWGYAWEFDDTGKKGEVEIDYETLARHLLILHETAQKNGLRIKKVIFDPVLQPYLFATKSGRKLQGLFYFTKGRVSFRHDDHYHVDFELGNE